ncbi:MAG: threonine aldolase [Verrucomicrobia bacterium]|nr:threonine aldolase [Verrucomicrobiota bacterium]
MKIIDLRSDTMTHPSPEMREAMYRAEVGDDCYGEDPTVNRLQELAADRLGKEAALFMPSGCMSNLAAVLAFCAPGEQLILGRSSDLFLFESGAPAVVGGIHPYPIINQPDGTLPLEEIERAIGGHQNKRGEGLHTALLCLENTNMLCGGVPLTPEYTATAATLARRYGVATHLDGERIFNAAVALGVDVKALTKEVDSVMFGLSKGLACPAGSVLCAAKATIAKARDYRKLLGGAMRQSGILAAAGIVALNAMIDRLAEDHRNARLLAEGLCEIPGLALTVAKIHTNIVLFDIEGKGLTRAEFTARLAEKGVKILDMGFCLRAVTHYGIAELDIKEALSVFRQVLESV